MYVWVGNIVSSGEGLSGYHMVFKYMIGFAVVGVICAVLLMRLIKKAKAEGESEQA